MNEFIKKILEKIELPQDKANHAFYGLLIYSLISLYSSFYAVTLVLVIAVLKEFWDGKGNGNPEIEDFYATAIPSVLLFILEILIKE